MKLHFTLFALILSSFSIAQDYNIAMKVTRADLQHNTYTKDSTANALVIYDYGNSYIDKKSFKLIFKTEHKIKILKAEGLDYGELEIKLYKGKSSTEEIKNIKATTYNFVNDNIERTQLTPEGIFEEDHEKYKLVKIVFPKVKVGSVITYSYETRSRFITKFQPWYFQGENPVLYSEYDTQIPGNYEYNIKLVGIKPLDVHDTSLKKHCIELRNGAGADCSIAKYVMKDIPAYKPEAFTTTPLNYMARIEYELSVVRGFDGSVDKITKTWESVDKELKTHADFGKQINRKNLVKKVLPNDIIAIENHLDKAKAIYNYVTSNYKWNKKYERYDVSVKNAIKDKIGNAFEINLILENLLSAEGFKVFPILISTRSNGLATKIYPVITDFNYLILKVNIADKDYYLDATDPYLSFGEIPFRSLNQYGRLIDFEDGSYWEDISVDTFSEQLHKVDINDFEDGTFKGEIDSRFTGYHAHNEKRKFDENNTVYTNNKAEIYDDIELIEHDVIDFSKSKFDFNEKISFELEPEIIGDKIYLNPFLIKFFEENPFKLQERTYPIDFGYKDVYNYVMRINLGEKFDIVEIPQGINYALPNKSGRLVFNIENNDNVLTLYFKIVFNEAIYGPEYYGALKRFMNKVVETQNNTVIVLKNN